jgi:hypothetical protein
MHFMIGAILGKASESKPVCVGGGGGGGCVGKSSESQAISDSERLDFVFIYLSAIGLFEQVIRNHSQCIS